MPSGALGGIFFGGFMRKGYGARHFANWSKQSWLSFWFIRKTAELA
jgi:hypothetical protein